MKPFVFLMQFLGVLLIATYLHAQSPATYMVIKVTGKVYSDILKRNLKTGDEISPRDKLSFSSKESYVHVINPSDGQKTVRNIPDTSPRDLMQLFEKFIDTKKQGAKSRGGNSEYLESLTEQLSRDKLLILGNGRIRVDTSKMALKKPFGVKVIYELGAKKIEKVISDQLGLDLSRNQLFESATPAPFPKVMLYYYEDLNDPAFKPFYPIGFFTPIYTDESVLTMEIKAIVNVFPLDPTHRPAVLQAIQNYLTLEYGDTLEENLKDWLEAQKIMR